MNKRLFPNKIRAGLMSFMLFSTSLIMMHTDALAADSKFTANAMAPLKVTDMNQFKSDLVTGKKMGMDAISVDVWWGDVEKSGDNQFDWSYYDTVFKAITDAELKIVPIMSFHQCGGNVGDDYTSMLPDWVWSKYSNQSEEGQLLSWENLQYKSSQGNYSGEYLSLWADEAVKNEYIDFMNAFEEHYGGLYAEDIMEINISGGPSGELRYPSYNSHDKGTDYPNKGAFQCYSKLAEADFRQEMLEKYGDLNAINDAWGSDLTSSSQITPPTDGDNFFKNGSIHPYYETVYGRDFLNWYNGSLVEHGENMLEYAKEAFDDEFKEIELGIKLPGVHWQMTSDTPRAAEVTAGIINSDFSKSNGYGYNPVLRMLCSYERKVVLHFTCLEMNDYSGNATSTPKALVTYIGEAAAQNGIEVKGENALTGGINQAYFWNNIKEALSSHGYNGITILRLRNAVTGEAYNYYKSLIDEYKINPSAKKVKVEFKVNKADTVWGQNVYIVGNTEELGNWDPEQAVKMSPAAYPTWEAAIELPAAASVEFKFIKKDGNGKVIWESGSNRTLAVGRSSTSYTSQWRS